MIFTPGFIFLSSYFSKENVSSEDNPDFYNKWGSLFTEFKKNRGFFSSQYYFLVFLRRLEYALSQVYLNSFLILQTSLNLCFSIIQLGFLIVYKPFKDPTAMISAFLGEISITATLGLSCGFLVNTNESILSAIEASIFVIVISTIAGQLLISIFLLIKSLKNFWKKVVQKSMKVFLKNADAPTPILFSVETIDSPGKNKNYRKVMPIRS